MKISRASKWVLFLKRVVTEEANIELSAESDTSCLLNKLIYLINRQYLCEKGLKPVTIQYLHIGVCHRYRCRTLCLVIIIYTQLIN